jgi:hypothetical protein
VQLSTVSLGLNKDKPNDLSLDVYKGHFEEDFLNDTEIYYTTESSHFIMVNTVAEYMQKVETRLQEETRRVEMYLHESTLAELTQKCERVLIEKHKETIQAEFPNLLEQDKVEDLTRMYSLLTRIVTGLDPLRAAFEKHVHKVGMQYIDAVSKTAINVSGKCPLVPSLFPFLPSFSSSRIPNNTLMSCYELTRSTTLWLLYHSRTTLALLLLWIRLADDSSTTTQFANLPSLLQNRPNCWLSLPI